MALTDIEQQSLRRHLFFGNISVGAFPYTNDGFQELFSQVIAPNLQTGNDCTGSTAIVAGKTGIVTIVTVDVATGILPRAALFVDVGDDIEEVIVKAVSGLTFTARFSKDHAAGGYPISTVSGESQLRFLLYRADILLQKISSPSLTRKAGLAELDRREVVFFPNNAVLRDTISQYKQVSLQISDIVRVKPAWYYEQSSAGSYTLF
jgi:hypothetical protein